MLKKYHLGISALSLVAGLSGGLSNTVLASTIENAVDTSVLTGRISLAYGDHTINSGLGTNVEVDNYQFSGVAGDSLRLVLSTTSGGLDPQIVLRDSTGVELQTTSCNGNTTNIYRTPIRCSAVLDQTLSSTGTYYLNVSDIGANEAGNYSLHLDTYPPANNWTGFAYDTPVDEALGHLGDMDFLAFNGAAGTGIQLTLASSSPGLDPNLEIWDPLGNLIEATSCSGNTANIYRSPILCSVSPTLNLTETGIYKIGLNDAGWNETGNYRLGLSCLYGVCPSAAPSAVPLPPAVWLFGSGLLGLASIVRRRNQS